MSIAVLLFVLCTSTLIGFVPMVALLVMNNAQTSDIINQSGPTSSPKTTLQTVQKSVNGMINPTNKLAFFVIPWWGQQEDQTPMRICDRLGIVPCGFGCFINQDPGGGRYDEGELMRYVDAVLEVKNKYKTNAWTLPFTLDIAMMPHGGMGLFTDSLLEQYGRGFKKAHDKGIRIRTRFLSEGNGEWFTGYAQKPEEAKALFIRFWNIIKKFSPDTEIMFNMNFNYSDCGSIVDPERYFPGPQYFDSVGLDIYYQHEGRCNLDLPQGNEIRNAITKCGFYQKFCVQYKKPLHIAETARAQKKGCGNDNPDWELKNKQMWWRQLIDPKLKADFPMLQSWQWFNMWKKESNEDRDFRLSSSKAMIDAFRTDMK